MFYRGNFIQGMKQENTTSQEYGCGQLLSDSDADCSSYLILDNLTDNPIQ